MRPEYAPEELQGSRILVVDDEAANVRVLERLLSRAGYHRVHATTDPRGADERFRTAGADLVLLDLHMPGMDGFELMSRITGELAPDDYLPILVLTGDLDPEVKRRALSAGARDFVTKPFETTEVLLRIKNLLETRSLHQEIQAHAENLEERVRERTRELAAAQIEILHRLARAAEYRDDVTGRHAERVGVLSALLALALDLPSDRVEILRRAAPLHDVGKIGIPDAILMKPGPLTPAEFEVMKTHTTIGAKILSGSDYELLQTARTIALHHHERWDGTGYNPGNSGEDIPLDGRIVAVADVFDSLTHERPYKSAAGVGAAVEEIHACSGGHFDPRVVRAFGRVMDALGDSSVDDLVELSAGALVEEFGGLGGE